jgi:hypothetical protein
MGIKTEGLLVETNGDESKEHENMGVCISVSGYLCGNRADPAIE